MNSNRFSPPRDFDEQEGQVCEFNHDLGRGTYLVACLVLVFAIALLVLAIGDPMMVLAVALAALGIAALYEAHRNA